MHKRNIIILSIVLVFNALFGKNISAMEIPILKDVRVVSSVEFNKNTKLYRYSYEVSNPSINTGQIRNVQIDISKPSSGEALSAEGLVIQLGLDRDGIMLTSTFKEELTNMSSLMKIPLLPVGIQPPFGWGGNITVIGTVSWGSDGKKYRIMPGQSLDSFVIISRGIPFIRDVSIKPAWVLVVEDVTEEDIKKSEEIEKQITFKGKTIGPTAPPSDFKPLDFLNYIIDLKHQSTSLGWITNKGIENSLDVKLDNAKKKLEQGNIVAAKNILNAFLNEVEAQGCATYENCPSGKHLTPEAYALLKYNVEYLINKL